MPTRTNAQPTDGLCQDCGAEVVSWYQYQTGDYFESPHPLRHGQTIKQPVLQYVCEPCFRAWEKPDEYGDGAEDLDAGVEVLLQDELGNVRARTWIEDWPPTDLEVRFECESPGKANDVYVPSRGVLTSLGSPIYLTVDCTVEVSLPPAMERGSTDRGLKSLRDALLNPPRQGPTMQEVMDQQVRDAMDNRPGAQPIGTVRVHTVTGKTEVWDGKRWIAPAQPSQGLGAPVRLPMTVQGSQATLPVHSEPEKPTRPGWSDVVKEDTERRIKEQFDAKVTPPALPRPDLPAGSSFYARGSMWYFDGNQVLPVFDNRGNRL